MSSNQSKDEVINVFYNSACPVCNAGIHLQQKRMTSCAINAPKIVWNDVHINNQLICQLKSDADLDFVRKRLHVKDAEGKVQVGIDAFITLWSHSPGESWKANLVSLPFIHGLATAIYNVFAFCLFHWNRSRSHW